MRMRAEPERIDFVVAVVVDSGADQIIRNTPSVGGDGGSREPAAPPSALGSYFLPPFGRLHEKDSLGPFSQRHACTRKRSFTNSWTWLAWSSIGLAQK